MAMPILATIGLLVGLAYWNDWQNGHYEQTAVGDKYVAENMMENNYSIGGEQSGHIIFSAILLLVTGS